MENNSTLEFNKLLNETKNVNYLIKKNELLECKQISPRKFFNIFQLLVNKSLKNIGKDKINIIDHELIVICDLRSKNEIFRSKIKINNSIECNTIEKAMKIFPKLKNFNNIDIKRKHVILYDSDGSIIQDEELDFIQKEIMLHLKRSHQFIKSISILKGGINLFNIDFPFICCSLDSEYITDIKSINDIPESFKSKIIASIEYPLLIGWGKKYNIYIGNILQGCHPQILNNLKIKTIFDFTPNGVTSKDSNINFIHINTSNNMNDEFITSNLQLERIIASIKELEEKYPIIEEIFPIMILSTNITNESISIASIFVSYLRKWEITTTLVFLLNQIGLDSNFINIDQNEELFKNLHPSNLQIAQMLKLNNI